MFFLIIALIYWLGLIRIPAFLIKRALAQVVLQFRAHSAMDAQNAKTIDELELNPPGFFERIGKPRDYKPTAFNLLLSIEVIKKTADQKVYLCEKELEKLCQNDGHNRLGLRDITREIKTSSQNLRPNWR